MKTTSKRRTRKLLRHINQRRWQNLLRKSMNKYHHDSTKKWGVCKLGSCQYCTIEFSYEMALTLLRYDRKRFEKTFKITYKEQLSQEEYTDQLWMVLEENKPEPEDDEEPIIIPEKITIEQYYELTNSWAWDLWSAAECPLSGFDMKTKLPSYAVGPLLNLMVQDENFQIGIYLAYHTYLFGTDLIAFADFDT